MKITSIEATLHAVPVYIHLIERSVTRPIVFVRVGTEEGITGYGLTGGIQRFAVKELINRELWPLLKNRNPLETESLWNLMYAVHNPRSQTGAWSSAVSAIDIALWDIKGKHCGEPVWRLLGGAQKRVPAYITFGLLEYSTEQLVAMAKNFVHQGEDKLKLVVAINNAQDPEEDAARVKAVREAIGDRVELMIDANHLFSLSNALELAKRVEPFGITWF